MAASWSPESQVLPAQTTLVDEGWVNVDDPQGATDLRCGSTVVDHWCAREHSAFFWFCFGGRGGKWRSWVVRVRLFLVWHDFCGVITTFLIQWTKCYYVCLEHIWKGNKTSVFFSNLSPRFWRCKRSTLWWALLEVYVGSYSPNQVTVANKGSFIGIPGCLQICHVILVGDGCISNLRLNAWHAARGT